MNTWHSAVLPARDDPGDWLFPPLFSRAQQDQIVRLQETTARLLGRELEVAIGPAAQSLGVAAFTRQLASTALDTVALGDAIRLLAMQDYPVHQARPPRPVPGGATATRNRQVWQRWQPWLQQQLLDSLQHNLREQLEWRCRLARAPAEGIAAAPILAAVRDAIATAGVFQVQEATLALVQPATGGAGWSGPQQWAEWQTLHRALAHRQPVLVELIREPGRFVPFADLVLVMAGAATGTGQIQLDYFSPTLHRQTLTLGVEAEQVQVVSDSAQQQGLADLSVKALRVWRLPGRTPPLFGLQRHLPTLLPWRLIRWLQRRCWREPHLNP